MPQAGTRDTEFEALISFKRFLVLLRSLYSLPPLASAHSTTTAPDVTGAFDILQLLAEGLHFHEMLFFRVTANSKISICPIWSTSFRSLSAILCCAWWKRLWIIQELKFSSKSTVHVSSYTRPISLVIDGARNYRKHSRVRCSSWASLLYGGYDVGHPLLESTMRSARLGDMIERYRRGRWTIIYAFRGSTEREASEPHDHIYTLGGLLDGYQLFVAPDYRKNTAAIYAASIQAIFLHDISVAQLELAVGVASENTLSLPSWVSDWSKLIIPWIYSNAYYASNSVMSEMVSNGKGCLVIEGFEVSAISVIGETVEPYHTLDVFKMAIERWRDMAGVTKERNKHELWAFILIGLFSGVEEQGKLGYSDLPMV